MNAINSNDEEIQNVYIQYKNLLSLPQNMFIKFAIFKNISFETIEKFKEDLMKISRQVEGIISKFMLAEDVTVFRSLSIREDDNLIPISKTNLISTSLDINQCSKFLILNKNYKHYLYQINLEKGCNVAVCPYSILLDMQKNQLLVTSKSDQKEVILSKKSCLFEQDLLTSTIINGEELNIISINARSINKLMGQSSMKK